MGISSLFSLQSRRAFNRDAPCSLSALISTPAGQLWSCDASARKCNCDTTHTRRAQTADGADWWSATGKLFGYIFWKSAEWYIRCQYNWDPTNTWDNNREKIALVLCAAQFRQLCVLDHPTRLGPRGRSSSRGGGWMWQETGHWAAASRVP